jgi:hypothetical protein
MFILAIIWLVDRGLVDLVVTGFIVKLGRGSLHRHGQARSLFWTGACNIRDSHNDNANHKEAVGVERMDNLWK